MSDEYLVYDGLQGCPYRPGQVARMPLYRQPVRLGLDASDRRFANAERRVGRSLYRTACPTCTSCQGLRIVVDAFELTKSQRRVKRRWDALGDRLKVHVGPATWSHDKVRLFNRHKQARGLAEAGEQPMDSVGYDGWLVQSCFETLEMRYLIDGELIGVGILDVGRTALSSVYFYFDPAEHIAKLSPGVYSTIKEVELCQQTGRIYHYLGLYVEQCRHLAYKADFGPHERLIGGSWTRFP